MASTPSRAQLQRERNAAEAGVQNDETPAGGMLLARDVYAVQMGHTVPLSGGPSTTYEATIGRSAHAGEAPVPALPTGADIARAAQADRVSPSVGSTPLAQRLDGLKAFQPKLLSGAEIGRKQREGSVVLRGPEDSPSLKTAAAQPRPVVPYQLDKPPHAPTMAAPRGQTHVHSTFALDDMTTKEVTHHGTPTQLRGSRSGDEEREFAAASDAATAAAREAPLRKLAGLTAQWSLA